MTDTKLTADKYISRGGGHPTFDCDEFVRDLITLGSFILFHDQCALRGGVMRDDAFSAMCRLVNLEQHRLREIIRPDGDSQ